MGGEDDGGVRVDAPGVRERAIEVVEEEGSRAAGEGQEASPVAPVRRIAGQDRSVQASRSLFQQS